MYKCINIDNNYIDITIPLGECLYNWMFSFYGSSTFKDGIQSYKYTYTLIVI